MKPTRCLQALATGLILIQYAGATDYQHDSTTSPFSAGFTPGLTSGAATTADKLIFSGTDVSYTATDDLLNITVNSEVFNNVAATLQTATIARGTGSLITLGGTTPYINFGNTNFAGVVETLDHTFTANGYITKTAGQAAAAANPVMGGALNLGANSVTFAIADSNGDGQAELTMRGALNGSGNLILNNVDATTGVGAPGAAAPDWGTLLLSANNASFTGPVTLTNGRLVVNNDNAAGTGTITVGGLPASGGVLSLGGNNGGAVVQNYGGLQGAATGFTLPNAINLGGETSGNYGQGLINNSGINTISGVVTLQQTPVNIQVNNLSSLTLSNSVGQSAAGDSLVKSGNGTLTLNNATFTGTSSSVTAGNIAFTGTPPAAGKILIGTSGAINVGTPGNAYPTAASVISSGRLLGTSTGVIALTGANAETISTGFLYPSLGIGATAAGAEYTGTYTPSNKYRLGGGGGVLTVTGTNLLTGSKIVEIYGAVIINGPNNFTGGLTLASNTLTLGAAGAIGSSGFITFSGGTLKFTVANTTDYSQRFSTTGTPFFNFDTNGQNITFSSNFVGTGGQILKGGTGTLTLGNGTSGNFGTANLFVEGGTLIVPNGATVTNTGTTNVGHLNGQTGTLTVQGTGSVLTTGDFNIGDVNTSNGTLNVAGTGLVRGGTTYVGKNGSSTGVINITGGGGFTQVGGGDTRIGGGLNAVDQAAVGIVNLVNGTFTTPNNFQIGAFGRGAVLQSGGTTTITGGYPSIGRYPTGYGVFDVSAGNVNYAVGGTGNRFIVGEEGTGILNVRGSGTFTDGSTSTTAGLSVGNNPVAASIGIVNLLPGGTINVRSIGKPGAGATATFNFNGGILKPTASNTTFMEGLSNAYIYPGNAIIDTNGFSVTMGQSFQSPIGSGVTSIAFTGGTGFTAAPIVELTGGDGVGATAVSTIDAGGNLTGFIITNPGTGYSVAPTVNLYNTVQAAGGALPTGLGAALGVNGSGGLVKNGTGTLTLSGFNTYNGNTTVNAGTLSMSLPTLPDTASVVVAPGAVLNLTHDQVDQVAALTINGVVKGLGIYDATSDPGVITGTGQIEVIGGGATGYDAFKANPANGLTAGVNDAPTADPDKDGIVNLLEYVFGGLPAGAGAANTSILPTKSLTATDLVITFKRTDASESDTTLKVQWSTDLVTWGGTKEVTIGATSSGIVTVAEDTPSSTIDTITVAIPRTNAVNGKLFARVFSSRP